MFVWCVRVWHIPLNVTAGDLSFKDKEGVLQKPNPTVLHGVFGLGLGWFSVDLLCAHHCGKRLTSNPTWLYPVLWGMVLI